jgi:alpha-tubulin suppressor-like RCC1 family protein
VGTSSWIQVSVGSNHTAAIRLGGSLFTWGNNFYGQLGSNTIVNRSSPVQVGTSSWTQVFTFGDNTIGVTTARTLFAWGDNSIGIVGDGTTINRSAPVQIHGSLGYLWSNKITRGNREGFFISPYIPNSEDGVYFLSTSSLTLVSSSETNIAIHRSMPTFIGDGAWTDVVAGPRQTYVMKLNT